MLIKTCMASATEFCVGSGQGRCMSMGLQQRYGTTARPFCSQATMPYSKGLNFANKSHTSISLLHHHQQQRLYSPCKDLGRLTPEVSLSISDTW
jgi:hypothetical protein